MSLIIVVWGGYITNNLDEVVSSKIAKAHAESEIRLRAI